MNQKYPVENFYKIKTLSSKSQIEGHLCHGRQTNNWFDKLLDWETALLSPSDLCSLSLYKDNESVFHIRPLC